jgi:fluoride ion exporter CrcB/FEX
MHISILTLSIVSNAAVTTFSTFSVDVLTWLQQGQTTKAASYVLANNACGIAAAAAGWVLVKKFYP